PDVVSRLDGVALLAQAQRRLAFQRDDVLLLLHVVVEGTGLPTRRQLLVGYADLAPALSRIGERAIAALKAHPLPPPRPWHAVDGNRTARLPFFGHVPFLLCSGPCTA